MTSGLRQRKPAQQENEPAPQDSEGSDCPAGQPVRRVKLVDGSKFSHLGVTLGEDRFGCGVAILDVCAHPPNPPLPPSSPPHPRLLFFLVVVFIFFLLTPPSHPLPSAALSATARIWSPPPASKHPT